MGDESSEYGFTDRQPTSLGMLLKGISLQLAALRNLCVVKGLVTQAELDEEIRRLNVAGALDQLDRDLKTDTEDESRS